MKKIEMKCYCGKEFQTDTWASELFGKEVKVVNTCFCSRKCKTKIMNIIKKNE